MGGGTSGGTTEVFLGMSSVSGVGSLITMGHNHFPAGAPAGPFGAYDFEVNAGGHIQFGWTAGGIGETAIVKARVIMFNYP
jgi:hypothetical protein